MGVGWGGVRKKRQVVGRQISVGRGVWRMAYGVELGAYFSASLCWWTMSSSAKLLRQSALQKALEQAKSAAGVGVVASMYVTQHPHT